MKAAAQIKVVGIEQARQLSKRNGAKFVWLGNPVRISLSRALGIKDSQLLEITPEELLALDDKKLQLLKGDIFVCYHGITSAAVVKYLKSKKNVEACSLKGGIAAIVGENY